MSNESKLGAHGLEVVGHRGIDPEGGEGFVGAKWPDAFGEACIVEPLCRLTDAQRLLSQLREELAIAEAARNSYRRIARESVEALAQRDAEIEQLKHKNDRQCESIKRYQDEGQGSFLELDMLRARMKAALESQQAASVGGDREAFEAGINPHCRKRNEHGDYVVPEIQDRWDGWQARAALSPAGGGVVYACPRCGTGMEVDTSAKPQANSQEGAK